MMHNRPTCLSAGPSLANKSTQQRKDERPKKRRKQHKLGRTTMYAAYLGLPSAGLDCIPFPTESSFHPLASRPTGTTSSVRTTWSPWRRDPRCPLAPLPWSACLNASRDKAAKTSAMGGNDWRDGVGEDCDDVGLMTEARARATVFARLLSVVNGASSLRPHVARGLAEILNFGGAPPCTDARTISRCSLSLRTSWADLGRPGGAGLQRMAEERDSLLLASGGPRVSGIGRAGSAGRKNFGRRLHGDGRRDVRGDRRQRARLRC